MIFSIPRSKSYHQQSNYQKYNDMHQSKRTSKKNITTQSPIQTINQIMNKSKSLNSSYSQNQTSPISKYIESPKKQLIYNKSKSRSFDKYLVQNKKKVQKQIILRNLNPEQKRIYQDSEENKKIYSGKKLVDPIHQKFNYYIKNQNRPKSPFIISDFLLEPCKINSKRIQSRPFTSQSFLPVKSENLQQKSNKYNKVRTHSSFAKTYQISWRQLNKNETMIRRNENQMEIEIWKQTILRITMGFRSIKSKYVIDKNSLKEKFMNQNQVIQANDKIRMYLCDLPIK